MLTLENTMELVNRRVNRVLDVAKAVIPVKDQFDAFRKIVLDEFGKCGLQPELERLDDGEKERDGKGRK